MKKDYEISLETNKESIDNVASKVGIKEEDLTYYGKYKAKIDYKREDDFITASSEWSKHDEYTHECEALIFAIQAAGSLGRTHYVNGKFIASNLCLVLTPKNKDEYPINLEF